MGPKSDKKNDNQPKKNMKEKAQQQIDESTFGMKNKNKSKKVQQFINRVEKSVKHNTGLTDAAKAKDAKKEAKIAKQLEEEQLRVLLNEGISNQFGKKKSTAQDIASKLGVSEQNAEVAAILEQFSSDSDDSDDENFVRRKKRNDDGPIYIDDEPESVEVFREKTIEDIIEEQRAKLLAEGRKGTPVTAETFAIWRANKLVRRQAEAEARVKAEQSKKKGGKGLSVLSGKELFNFNSSLFVDDDAAITAKDERDIAMEAERHEEEERQREEEDRKRAEAEQTRLAEARQAEEQAKVLLYEAKRARAKDASLVKTMTVLLLGIRVNKMAFEEEEKEDLDIIVVETLTEQEQVEEGDAQGFTVGQTFSIENDNENDENDENENDDEDGEDGEDDEGDNDESEGEDNDNNEEDV